MALVQKTEEFVEAMAIGVIGRGAALVPLANEARRVAHIVEDLGDGPLFRRHAEARYFILRARRVEFVAEARGYTPREKSRP